MYRIDKKRVLANAANKLKACITLSRTQNRLVHDSTECERQPPLDIAEAAAGARYNPVFLTQVHRMPKPVRKLLIERKTPSSVSPSKLLRSLLLSREHYTSAVIGARMPAKKAVLRIPGLLDLVQCKRLCEAVDKRMTQNRDTVDGAPDFQLNVEEDNVPNAIRLIQDHTRKKLNHAAWRLLQLQMKGDNSPAASNSSTASLFSAEDMDLLTSISACPPKMFVRRYSPDTRPFIPFHCDSARVTVNVSLNNDSEFEGGELLALLVSASG